MIPRSPSPAHGEPSRPRSALRRGHGTTIRWSIFILFTLLVCAVGGPPPVRAAAPPPPDNEAEAEYARAMVTLDGEPLFLVSGVMAYPAETRAQVIAGRIQGVAADRSIPVDALRIVETDHGSDILAGDRFLMTVTETDTRQEGVSRSFMASAVRRRIADAIAEYRSERTPRALLMKTVYTLGATLVAGLLLLGIRRTFRWLDGLAERRFRARIEGFEAAESDAMIDELTGYMIQPDGQRGDRPLRRHFADVGVVVHHEGVRACASHVCEAAGARDAELDAMVAMMKRLREALA